MIGMVMKMKTYLAKRHMLKEADGMMKSADLASAFDDVIDLSLGDPDLDTDDRIIDAAFQDVKNGYTHYAPALGDPDLIQAIQDEYLSIYHYCVETDQIMVTASGCHAMWLVLETILDPEDEVLIFSPYFTPYPEQIKLAQGKPVIVPLCEENGFQIDIAQLKTYITEKTKAILINTPCNPTGVCLDSSVLEAIRDIAVEYDLLVIADDIYTLYTYKSAFVPIMTLRGMRERTITIRSFSKDYCMSGWRIGCVVAPKSIIQAMRTVNENNVFVAPAMSQRAAYHALRLKDAVQPDIQAVFKARADYIYERVQRISYVSMLPPEGTIYTFLNIQKTGLTSQEFADRLFMKYHISVVPGSAFGPAGEGYVRIAQRVDIPTFKRIFDLLEQDAQWNR